MRTFVITLLCLLLMLGSTMAGDWKVKGQIRYRYAATDKDFDDETGFGSATVLRSRLNAKFKPNEHVKALIQIQDSRAYGEELSTLNDGSADNLDVHQAYFVISDFAVPKLSLKMGRFEAVYGPQRLIGAVGWHNIGRSFDGVVLNYENDFIDADVFHMKDGGKDVNGIYAVLNIVENQQTHGFFIQDASRSTAGGYGVGKFGNLAFEGEGAYQFGELTGGSEVSAWMAAFNVSLKLESFSIGGGIDMISGDDSTTAESESFNTLYATNHKYYGSMDYFLDLPRDTEGLGLVDIYFKAGMKPIAGWAPSLAYHIFNSQQESVAGDSDFGSELDLSFKHKYNKNVTIVAGYSMFMPGALKATDGDNGKWAWLMTVVNF